jgi:hypothetical protein
MTKHIKYNGKSMTESELEVMSLCDGKHKTLTELFKCIPCRYVFEYK